MTIGRWKVTTRGIVFQSRVRRSAGDWPTNFPERHGSWTSGNYVRVQYSDLVSRPRAVFDEIGATIGLDLVAIADAAIAGSSFAAKHGVGGNRVRYQTVTLTPSSDPPPLPYR